MKTYGRLSLLLFVALVLITAGIWIYIFSLPNGTVPRLFPFLGILAVVLIMPSIGYLGYFIVKVSNGELIVLHNFGRKRTSYFMHDIQAVSLDIITEGRRSKKLLFTVFKKDKTQDDYIVPTLFKERNRLLKELGKYVDVI